MAYPLAFYHYIDFSVTLNHSNYIFFVVFRKQDRLLNETPYVPANAVIRPAVNGLLIRGILRHYHE